MRRAAAGAFAVLALAAPGVARAENPSLPSVDSGARPGPDLLYADAPYAPQLESLPPFAAPPILVSGASAYRDGEFLYQDFLHDDRGAAGVGDPNDPLTPARVQFKGKEGTLTYPTAAKYTNNAADLVELRVRPLADATAFRVTLNSMVDPQVAAFTIAIGSSPQARPWPDQAGVSSPAALFLTVHGDHAQLTDAASGRALAPAPAASVDLKRRQMTVTVPHAAWDPGRSVVRFAAGVGLWDVAAGHYAVPAFTASETQPGGAASNGAAIFNLAFRSSEPAPEGPPLGVTLIDISVQGNINSAYWRERAQADALRDGDVGAFHADVDFAKLARRVADDSAVPRAGSIDRIVADHLDLGQGIDLSKLCGRFPAHCDGAIPEQLQAYTVYVPDKPRPAGGWGLTMLPHALNENENQYDGSRWQAALGNRGTGYLVVTPSSVGPDGDYTDAAEANFFDTWADVARHYRLDPDRTTISGYSMGGGAVYRLGSRWPDLFARGTAMGAAPIADQTGLVGALRNMPLLTWVESADEGTPASTQQSSIDDMVAHHLEFTFDTFTAGDHGTLPSNDEFAPFAQFLGDARVDRDPPRLSYGLVPAHDFARAGLGAAHDAWLSGLRGRDAKADSTVDAFSQGFGRADPSVLPLTTSPGVLEGGRLGPQSYVERREAAARPKPAPARDHLVLETHNLRSLTVDAGRARLSCAPDIALKSDGPLDLNLTGCAAGAARATGPARRRAPCVSRRRIRITLPRVRHHRVRSTTVR